MLVKTIPGCHKERSGRLYAPAESDQAKRYQVRLEAISLNRSSQPSRQTHSIKIVRQMNKNDEMFFFSMWHLEGEWRKRI